MKFLLLIFALMPRVVSQFDEFVKIVRSYLFISTLFLVGKSNNPDCRVLIEIFNSISILIYFLKLRRHIASLKQLSQVAT